MDAQNKRIKKRIGIFILVSLFIHAFVMIGLYFSRLGSTTPYQEQTVFIDLSDLPKNLNDQDANKGQIVQTEQADKQVEPQKTNHLSEKNQFVQEETKAKNVDIFRKGGESKPGKAGQKLSFKDLAPGKVFTPPTKQEIEGYKQAQKQAQKAAESGDEGQNSNDPSAASNDYLTDVKEGNKTLLNTKEFIYYGYYNRIRQSLEVAWNSKLRAAMNSYIYGGRQLASAKNYVTGLIVVLDRNGKVTGVQVLQRSGAHDLDQAAIDAFNDAGPFPDPPAGLVDEKGEIRIRWDFILQS